MERLIELVRSEPCLYDTYHPEYSKKTLKELLWAKIAKKLNYKDGPSVKEAWLKLRNCHRDAVRRRNKLSNSGYEATISKIWKYEKQMEFLLPFMNNRSTSRQSTSTENSSQSIDSNKSEHLLACTEVELVATSKQNESLHTGSPHILPSSPGNNVVDDSKESVINNVDLNTTNTKMLINHNRYTKEKAEKKSFDCNNEDELQQFFKAMYTVTKKMPALSQNKLKRKIFNLVADEEEHLLNFKVTSTITPTSDTCTSIMLCSDDETSEQ